MQHRVPEYQVNKLFLQRWSARAYLDARLEEADVLTLLEAARWAPSSYNEQPWRFLYALRGSAHYPEFLAVLNDFNKAWAQHASALVLVSTKRTLAKDGMPNIHALFDAGAATENLALQAASMGLSVHAMGGFDHELARTTLKIPIEYDVPAMLAIGYPGKKETLPPQLQEREFPSMRKPLSEVAWEGLWKKGMR
jgi:nitroreductase